MRKGSLVAICFVTAAFCLSLEYQSAFAEQTHQVASVQGEGDLIGVDRVSRTQEGAFGEDLGALFGPIFGQDPREFQPRPPSDGCGGVKAPPSSAGEDGDDNTDNPPPSQGGGVSGVIPYNTGVIGVVDKKGETLGKFSAATVGRTRSEVDELHNAFQERLSNIN